MVTLSTRLLRARWLVCLTLVAVAGLLLVSSSGCVPPPPPDDPQQSSSGSDNNGGADSGGGTTGSGDGSGADGGTDSGGGDAPDGGGGTSGGGTSDGGGTDGGGMSGGGGTSGGGTTGDGGDATDGGGSGGGGTDGGGSGGDGIDDVPDGGGSDGGDAGGGGGGDGGGSDGGDDDVIVPDPGPPTSVALDLIVQTGDPVPEQPADTTFTYFGDPVIDAEGRIAFWGLYEGATARGGAGLYVWDGELQRVLDDDPLATGVVPGRETADFFGKNGPGYDPRERDLVWGAGDRLVFTSEVGGEVPTRGAYRWRATDGNMVRIADREQVVQVYREEVRDLMDPKFFLPGVSDNGLAGFSIGYIGIDPSTTPASFFSGQGVFTSNGTSVSVLRDTELSGDTPGDVPDQGGAAFYVTITDQTTMSPSGDLLFEGRYAGGDGLLGLYLARGGEAYRVIDNRPNASWPGLPDGARLNSAGTAYVFAIGPAGHIAVETTLTMVDDGGNVVIVWDWEAGDWASLTGGGSEATALVTGVNDDGQVVLLAGGAPYLTSRTGHTQLNASLPAELQGATLTWLDEGGSINNHSRAVLHYQDGDANPGLVMWTGAQLLVVADAALDSPAADIVEISTVTDPRRDLPGRSGMFNDSNECVLRTVFSDDSEAIYVARGES